jgi:S1-C subfamily serine protease
MYKHLVTAAAAGALLLIALPGLAQTQESESSTRARGAFLGIQAESAPASAEHEGAIVRKVEPNSPAAKAGLKRGDIITKMANQEIADFEELNSALSQHKPGQKMTVEVLRNGQPKELTVTLGRRPTQAFRGTESEQAPEEQGYYGRRKGTAFLGVESEELTPSLRRQEGISARQGVVVAEVLPNSPAEQAGLQEGDVITKVNEEPITNPDELRDAIQNAGPGHEVTLDVMRGRRHQELTAQLGRGTSEFGAPTGQFYGMSPSEQSRQIQRLQQQIRSLERRLRSLEQQQSRGGFEQSR